MPLYTNDGGGQPLPTREQRIREHAANLKKTQGLSAIIETWFIDDLIEEVKVQPHGYLSALCKEFNLTASTLSGYMSAARFYTLQERLEVDPESNLPMTVWKHAYEKTETENSGGLQKEWVLDTIRGFIRALDKGELWYEDDDSQGLEATVTNLKSHLSDAYDLLGLGVSVAREFYPAIEITPEAGNAACEAVGYAQKPFWNEDEYDHFVRMTFIRRRKRETSE